MRDLRFDDGGHLFRRVVDGGRVFGRGEHLFEFGDGVVGGDFAAFGLREEGVDVEAREGFDGFAVAFAAFEFGRH